VIIPPEDPIITPQHHLPTQTQRDERDIDVREFEQVRKFRSDGCGCSNNCNSLFDEEYILRIRADMAELSHDEFDMILMGQVMAFSNMSETTCGNKRMSKERVHSNTSFYHQGIKVNKSAL
jgi:hypothetical protein